MSGPFAARFHGVCAECDGGIKPGQVVRYDDADQIVHADDDDCDADATTSGRQPAVCPSCWTTHAGECM